MRSSRTAMHALQRTPALTTINVGEVNHETGKGANYEVPAKITPIQVKPSSFYNQGPQPIQPYLPQSRTNSGYQQLSGGYQQPSGGYQQPNGGYQHPSGGYLQPHQSFQPPPPSLLQPQPFSIPQAPVYQPQPPYQVSPVQSTPQQGCCGGQLFSQQVEEDAVSVRQLAFRRAPAPHNLVAVVTAAWRGHPLVVLSLWLHYVVIKWFSHAVNHSNDNAAIRRIRLVAQIHSKAVAVTGVKCPDCADDALNGRLVDYLVFAGQKYARLLQQFT
ncbi:hypothetical protein RB195_003124 [Necator americanus]|uniref:Uncharacterized protein n=1 Tax=Necator americanus TaxID=51031 RepID=A0ABR1DM45_NECAM